MSSNPVLEDLKNQLRGILPNELFELIEGRDSAGNLVEGRDSAEKLVTMLPAAFSPEQVSTDDKAFRAWEVCGLFYQNQRRFHEALRVFRGLYYQILAYQLENKIRAGNKGTPLVWMSECHLFLNRPVIARRFLMLTMIEDAISSQGIVSPETTGSYFRLVWREGLSNSMVERYGKQAYSLYEENREMGIFPEWILQQFDQEWLSGYPSREEVDLYPINRIYAKFLLDKSGDAAGEYLELLAEYVLSVMPGCRTYRRRKSKSSDLDIVCAVEGIESDFRSELGRYFIAECKDWNKPANFSAFAKFCRVLDSVKARFGILFSRKGITGAGKTTDAEREQVKVFQDRGIIIVVVDRMDLESLTKIEGGASSFTAMLRQKYEATSLDLVSAPRGKTRRKSQSRS